MKKKEKKYYCISQYNMTIGSSLLVTQVKMKGTQ